MAKLYRYRGYRKCTDGLYRKLFEFQEETKRAAVVIVRNKEGKLLRTEKP